MAQTTKVVIVTSSFYIDKGDNAPEFRQIPELDKLFGEGWLLQSITPVVSNQASQSVHVASMQLVINLYK